MNSPASILNGSVGSLRLFRGCKEKTSASSSSSSSSPSRRVAKASRAVVSLGDGAWVVPLVSSGLASSGPTVQTGKASTTEAISGAMAPTEDELPICTDFLVLTDFFIIANRELLLTSIAPAPKRKNI